MNGGPDDGGAGRTAELVALGDLDELLRHVDRVCDRRDWDAVVALAQQCRAAVARGYQLWPAATWAAYRCALEGPGPVAAWALTEGGDDRFAPGPFAEVAASTHRFAELDAHLPAGAPRDTFALERVARGEDLAALAPSAAPEWELPTRLAAWEPGYPLAHYGLGGVTVDEPPDAPRRAVDLHGRAPSRPVDDPLAVDALVRVTATWVRDSDGRAEAVAVEGDALDAVAALGVRRARVAQVSGADALAVLAWAGATGGAHGRRRGAAAGRFEAWWAAAALAGLDWPPEPDELADALDELRWFVWDAAEPATGWALRLAVDDPADGVGWAVAAIDAR